MLSENKCRVIYVITTESTVRLTNVDLIVESVESKLNRYSSESIIEYHLYVYITPCLHIMAH